MCDSADVLIPITKIAVSKMYCYGAVKLSQHKSKSSLTDIRQAQNRFDYEKVVLYPRISLT